MASPPSQFPRPTAGICGSLPTFESFLATNIAVQRPQLQTQIERDQLSIRLTICSALRASHCLRFSPVMDVLPFPGLFLFTRPIRLSNVPK